MLFKFQKNIFYIIFFISVLFVYDAFTNTYIVMRENYSQRIIKNAGYCDRQGYGFYKFIIENYPNQVSNIEVINFNDQPSPGGYFFKYEKTKSSNEIVLIGIDEDTLSKYSDNGYKIIYSKNNCFYLKK